MDQKLPWRIFWTLHPLGPVDPKEQDGHSIGYQQRGYQPGEQLIFIDIVHVVNGLIYGLYGLVVIGGKTLDRICVVLFIVGLVILKKEESIQHQQQGQ